jgi:LmbE family N-acetylglucosaminyl deacetylase
VSEVDIAGDTGVNPIDAPGTSETIWRGWPDLTRLPALDVGAWGSAVILAAHPDDEVLGVGGIVSVLAAAGTRLRLIAVTDGESSHPGHDHPAELARRRARERASALFELGAGDAEVIRLGLPDSGLSRRDDELTAGLRDLVAGFDVCLAPWERDVHADHEAVGRAARWLGGMTYFYPVWMWHWARPGDPRVPWAQAVAAPLPAPAPDLKRAAISCFGSQLESRGPGGPAESAGPEVSAGPVLTPDFVAHFTRDYEVLFPVIRP